MSVVGSKFLYVSPFWTVAGSRTARNRPTHHAGTMVCCPQNDKDISVLCSLSAGTMIAGGFHGP